MMRSVLLALLVCSAGLVHAQLGEDRTTFTRADSLRGSIGPYRSWWDVSAYVVTVRPNLVERSIQGSTTITFGAFSDGQRMQIDLQQPLVVDSITTLIEAPIPMPDGWFVGVTSLKVPVAFERDGDVIWVDLPKRMESYQGSILTIHYHGVPRAARNPPWDGGWIWKKDAQGNPWVSVACQGLGASVWYPCKDHQSDEPEEGATLRIIVPDSLQGIGNGRLRGTWSNGDGTTTWEWQVSSTINTYNLIPYIGKYAHWNEVYAGMDGPLQCDYWVLASNEAKAREQFKQVPEMLQCFEEWLGPYPFYRDGYKLVESPHLGMEHQSAIAYGNGFVNGYRGTDLSGSGHGLKWDYIIIHESGHEWFGNSITTADIADMWVHEGFTDYTETIFTECQQGTEAAEDYLVGLRKNIRNDRPIIGPYGVNQEGSGDMYYKGANLIHMIRHIVGDSTFKAMLLEMDRQFGQSVITSAQIEAFMIGFSAHTRERLHTSIFDQYLRDVRIPELEHAVKKKQLWVRWTNCPDSLRMPIRINVDGTPATVNCTTQWTCLERRVSKRARIAVDRAWYVGSRRVSRSKVHKPGERLRNSFELSF
jgi:aminopeptidase N